MLERIRRPITDVNRYFILAIAETNPHCEFVVNYQKCSRNKKICFFPSLNIIFCVYDVVIKICDCRLLFFFISSQGYTPELNHTPKAL